MRRVRGGGGGGDWGGAIMRHAGRGVSGKEGGADITAGGGEVAAVASAGDNIAQCRESSKLGREGDEQSRGAGPEGPTRVHGTNHSPITTCRSSSMLPLRPASARSLMLKRARPMTRGPVK